MSSDMTEYVVPDGGRGWAVVVAAATINVFNQSLLSMFGLIFGQKLETLAGTTGLTTVMSLNVTISNFSGFLINPLSKILTTRQITQIAVVLVSLGLAVSSYTTSYVLIVMAYGISTGLGLGLIASSTFLIVNSYFDKNKSQAIGLSMAGTSIGQMIMPLTVALCSEHYGNNGTMLILSGLSLHGIPAAIFFDPVSKHMIRKGSPKTRCWDIFRTKMKNIFCIKRKTDFSQAIANNDKYGTETSSILSYNDTRQENTGVEEAPINNLQVRSKCDENEPKNNDNTEKQGGQEEFPVASRWWFKIINLLGLQVLSDPIFVHIMIGLSLAYTTSISFSTFFPLFLTEDLGMGLIETSTCMTALSLMDLIGRILVPVISKRFNVTHRTTFTFSSLLLAASRSALVKQNTYFLVIVFSCICGLARAATIINQNLVVAEYAKDSQISSAVGLNMVSKGIFILATGRLLGAYKDSSHNFSSCIHILDVISLSVVVSWTLEILARKLFSSRKCRT